MKNIRQRIWSRATSRLSLITLALTVITTLAVAFFPWRVSVNTTVANSRALDNCLSNDTVSNWQCVKNSATGELHRAFVSASEKLGKIRRLSVPRIEIVNAMRAELREVGLNDRAIGVNFQERRAIMRKIVTEDTRQEAATEAREKADKNAAKFRTYRITTRDGTTTNLILPRHVHPAFIYAITRPVVSSQR